MYPLKSKLYEASEEFAIPITTKEDIEISKNSIKIKWSDGTNTRYTVEAEPLMVDDSTTIKVNYRLKATKGSVL